MWIIRKKSTPRIKETVSEPIHWVWVTNYYDFPLAGTCLYDNDFCYVELYNDYDEAHDGEAIYFIKRLTWYEKIKWKLKQKMFELMVGYHWTYKDGKRDDYAGSGKDSIFKKICNDIYYRWFSK